MHRRFAPQITQQCIPLFAHRTQPLPAPAGVFARDHADVTASVFPSLNRSGSPRNTSVANAVIGPTPGCVSNRRAWGCCEPAGRPADPVGRWIPASEGTKTAVPPVARWHEEPEATPSSCWPAWLHNEWPRLRPWLSAIDCRVCGLRSQAHPLMTVT